MGNLSGALRQLRVERKQAQLHMEKLDQAISAIESFKRFGAIAKDNSTSPNHIGSFTAQDGTGAKGEMGAGSEGIAANRASENNELGTCKAHHVSSGPQEDRSVSAGKVGEVEGAAEEGGVALDGASLGTTKMGIDVIGGSAFRERFDYTLPCTHSRAVRIMVSMPDGDRR